MGAPSWKCSSRVGVFGVRGGLKNAKNAILTDQRSPPRIGAQPSLPAMKMGPKESKGVEVCHENWLRKEQHGLCEKVAHREADRQAAGYLNNLSPSLLSITGDFNRSLSRSLAVGNHHPPRAQRGCSDRSPNKGQNDWPGRPGWASQATRPTLGGSPPRCTFAARELAQWPPEGGKSFSQSSALPSMRKTRGSCADEKRVNRAVMGAYSTVINLSQSTEQQDLTAKVAQTAPLGTCGHRPISGCPEQAPLTPQSFSPCAVLQQLPCSRCQHERRCLLGAGRRV